MSAIDILFRVKGQAEFDQAIGGISKSLDRLASNARNSANQAVKDRVSAEERAAKAAEDASKRAQKASDAAAKKASKDAKDAAKDREKAETDAAKAARNAEKDKEKAAKDAEREKQRLARETASIRNQINNLEVREYLKAEREKTQAAESEARKRQAAQSRFGRQVGNSTTRVLGMAGRAAAGLVALGGGFSFADSVQTGIENEARAGLIVRGAATNPDNFTNADVQRKAGDVAQLTGSRSSEVLGGLDKFVVNTGDLRGAMGMIGDLGKYALASGASLEDMGTVGAEAFRALGGDGAKTRDVLLTLIQQGRKGAVDFRDFGQYGGRIINTAGLYEGDIGQNIKTLGSLTQIARSSGPAVTAAEATESSLRLFDEIAMHKDKFEAILGKGGTKNAQGQTLSPEKIMIESLVKEKGNMDFIPHLLGRQAGRAEIGLAKIFNEARGTGTDEESLDRGRRKAYDAVHENMAPMSGGEVDALAADAMKETQKKINVALEQFNRAINSQLLPLLPGLIDEFKSMIPVIASVVETFTKFPKMSIGGLIAGAIAADVAKAKLGDIIANAIAGRSGASAGVGAGGAGFGALAITAMAAVTITAMGVNLIDNAYKAKDDAYKDHFKVVTEAENATGALRGHAPGATAAGQEALAALRSKLKFGEDALKTNQLGGPASANGVQGWGEHLLNYMLPGSGFRSHDTQVKQNAQTEQEGTVQSIASLKAAIAALETAMQQATTAAQGFSEVPLPKSGANSSQEPNASWGPGGGAP